LLAPGIYDALSAALAQAAGAEAAYLSGASIAYARLGRPDIGLVAMSEVAETLQLICERIDIPVIVDADTGFGNAINVQRTVRRFERCGAAAIQLEDQTAPKRCGHLSGKSLISGPEMVGKIKAALDARHSDETLIVARTDAIAVEGLDKALERAVSYKDAGADMLFVEAPRSTEDMQKIVETLGPDVPLLANMVEGGMTPDLDASSLEKIGYALVIFPGGLARAFVPMAQAYFSSLLEHGTTAPFRGRMTDLQGINDAVDTAAMLAAGKTYEEPAK
jgi:2-methylisocitrate lyase-like PEP mutase family enzyme